MKRKKRKEKEKLWQKQPSSIDGALSSLGIIGFWRTFYTSILEIRSTFKTQQVQK
jgi:hypothetical protein